MKKCWNLAHLYAPLAQLAEHLTLNQGVQGSNPWSRTIKALFWMTSREHRGRCFFSCSLHKREVPLHADQDEQGTCKLFSLYIPRSMFNFLESCQKQNLSAIYGHCCKSTGLLCADTAGLSQRPHVPWWQEVRRYPYYLYACTDQLRSLLRSYAGACGNWTQREDIQQHHA